MASLQDADDHALVVGAGAVATQALLVITLGRMGLFGAVVGCIQAGEVEKSERGISFPAQVVGRALIGWTTIVATHNADDTSLQQAAINGDSLLTHQLSIQRSRNFTLDWVNLFHRAW